MKRDDALYQKYPRLYDWMAGRDPENIGLNGTDLISLVGFAMELESELKARRPEERVHDGETHNELVKKARLLYAEGRHANVSYPSITAARQVREFIRELADALDAAERDFMQVHKNCIEARARAEAAEALVSPQLLSTDKK